MESRLAGNQVVSIMKTPHRIACTLLAALALAACSRHDALTVQRSLSPLIGTWTRDGDTPKGSGNGGPQFTKLTFAADGKLSANYVAAGLGAILGSSPSVKAENDTYATPDATTLSIAEGTTHLDYSYRVSGSKLYLTPPGGGDAAVFTKAG
jgi:hypothetical protein